MRKKKLALAAVALLLAFGLYSGRYYVIGTSSQPVQGYTNQDFNIADVHSSQDRDGDGIDDQLDILQGARAYIATNPVYKSRYYEGGWPDDKYGVCTDVVARALLNAGYDLQQLVAEDIAAAPEAYGVEEPDANIDFRRVQNLRVYLERNALSLTSDVWAIEEWQGGDIVVFKRHIGIVSDQRNREGIAYVLHHSNPFQAAYEEDILTRRNDLVGHYRLSE